MSHQNTDPEDQLLDRLISLIDDHVYADGNRYERWVEGIDEAAAAIIDDFDVREHDDGDTATVTIYADTDRFKESLSRLIAQTNKTLNGPKQ